LGRSTGGWLGCTSTCWQVSEFGITVAEVHVSSCVLFCTCSQRFVMLLLVVTDATHVTSTCLVLGVGQYWRQAELHIHQLAGWCCGLSLG
jgi:hypothetical protein